MENTGNIGFEETLWKAADKLRGSMDASEYKHVVLGLIFLKYISDKFETKYNELVTEGEGFEEDRDEYASENIFWVPKESRWTFIMDNAKDIKIGQFIDDAMILIEKENTSLKGVLDKRYARPEIDKRRLGELIDLISTIKLHDSVEGKGGGEFDTPTSIVKTLVEMIEPYQGRVYDPCCGSGGMFVQSEKFVEDHQGKIENLSIYGQEMNSTTWKLCKMNLVIRGLDANLGSHHDDTFHNDLHKTLKADFILANPPFNISDWGGGHLTDDVRWKFGMPPTGNANYAWLQHMVYHLAPNGAAGIVLANGSLSSNTSNEGEIRKNLLEGDLVDAIVALPDKLFYSTGIPVSLWILNRNKATNPAFRSRYHEVLKDDDVSTIAAAYHAWRNPDGAYEDVKGFCKVAKLAEIREHE